MANAVTAFRGFRKSDKPPREDSGLITMADMAGYSARLEPALTYEYHGWTVGASPGPGGVIISNSIALRPPGPRNAKSAHAKHAG